MGTRLFRRLMGAESESSRRAPDIIHILPDADADLDAIAARLARLEDGTRLIVETMRRAYADLGASLDGLREELVRTARDETAAAIGRSVSPLAETLTKVAEAVGGFPHVLAAATDDVIRRIDHAAARPSREPVGVRPGPSGPMAHDGGTLPATPFDLEPVERQFGAASDVIKVPNDTPGWENGQAPSNEG